MLNSFLEALTEERSSVSRRSHLAITMERRPRGHRVRPETANLLPCIKIIIIFFLNHFPILKQKSELALTSSYFRVQFTLQKRVTLPSSAWHRKWWIPCFTHSHGSTSVKGCGTDRRGHTFDGLLRVLTMVSSFTSYSRKHFKVQMRVTLL